MDVRKAGMASFKKSKSSRGVSQNPFGPLDSRTGDTYVNQQQMSAILHLFNSNPSIQAARSVIVGQLLSSGLCVKRSGKEVKLTATFEDHLRSRWIPFAREVIDATLCWGFCPVSMDIDDAEPFAALKNGKRSRDDDSGASQDKTAATAADVSVAPRRPGPRTARNLIPFVPTFGTYEIVLSPHGRGGYRRKATVFTTSTANAYQADEYTEVFFRSFPDPQGNIVSPIAACFDYVSFVAALKELALSAELVRATPTLVTQSTPNNHGAQSSGIDPAALFFDSESRNIQSSAEAEDSGDRTRRLDLTVRLANEINRMRTTVQDAGGGGPPPPSHLPPEVPPRLFALPEKQQLVPGALQPQSRTDLEQLMRLSNDHVAAALGVPALVLFEGRFSSNTVSQIQLLNTTVAAIASHVNTVLSLSYRTIYNSDDDELALVVCPISSVTEVQGLYQSGVIDFETALPAAMHALGSTEREIGHALERRRTKEKKLEAERDELAKTERTAVGLGISTPGGNTSAAQAAIDKGLEARKPDSVDGD